MDTNPNPEAAPPRQAAAPAALERTVSAPGVLLTSPARTGGRRALLPRLIVAALCGGYATGAALGWGSGELALIMGDFGLTAAAALAAASCLAHARAIPGRQSPAWVLFAASSAMVALGNAIWGWYEVVLREPVPRTSAADFCFLLFAPFAIVGLLVLAKRPVSRAGWVCLVLDAWLIGGSLLTLSWSLALSRAAEYDGRGTLRVALSLAYPLLDITLVSMVLALHFRRSPANRAAVNTAIGALALTVLCDALFTSPVLREHYRSGQVLDAGWFAGSMLLAYAPWSGRRTLGSRTSGAAPDAELAAGQGAPDARGPQSPGAAGEFASGAAGSHDEGRADAAQDAGGEDESGSQRRVTSSLAALTPYLAAAVCVLGILYDVVDHRRVSGVVVVTGCLVVLALVVRQGIMLLDNIALTQELVQKENHFRSLVQGSSDVIMIATPTGTLSYVSPAARGVYGREAEAMIGTELTSHIHPGDIGRFLHEVRRFLAAGPADEPATRIECRIRSGDGGWLHVESTVNRYRGGLIFNSRDVTERVRLQAQLQHNASHDPLTDLPNRALFTERVRQALGGRRTTDGPGAADTAPAPGTAVLFIDLDGFKAVNDTVGHHAGDDLLVQAARRLTASVRGGDTAARLGGDEFAALIRGGGDQPLTEAQVRDIAERLRAALSEPYETHGRRVRVGASVGIAFAAPGLGPRELLRNADTAMYRAKQGGKGRVEVHTPARPAAPGTGRPRGTGLGGRLRAALHDGRVTLLHQPVVDLAGGEVAAVETHARWRAAQGALFAPADFRHLAAAAYADTAHRADPPEAAYAAESAAAVADVVAGADRARRGTEWAGRGERAERVERWEWVDRVPGVEPPGVTGPEPRGGRGERRERGGRGDRSDRSERWGRSGGDDQPDRSDWSGWSGRPDPGRAGRGGERSGRSGRTRRSERRDRTDRSVRSPGGPGDRGPDGEVDGDPGGDLGGGPDWTDRSDQSAWTDRPGGPDPVHAHAAELGSWLLEEALRRTAQRYRRGHPVPASVRLPAHRVLRREPSAREIRSLLERHGLPPGGLILRLTGGGIRQAAPEDLERRLAALRGAGAHIALDGPGGGFAALAALHRLPVDYLRLDPAFTDGLVESAGLRKTTAGLLRIAADLGIRSVAEGVDRPEHAETLHALGCTHAQGAAFAGPLDDRLLLAALDGGGYPVQAIGGATGVFSQDETPVPPA
jgi:diguanylate cyclase (GGDEF)-like protein/PAS domain S-box-containing protein